MKSPGRTSISEGMPPHPQSVKECLPILNQWRNASPSSISLLFSGLSCFSLEPFLMKIQGALSRLRFDLLLWVDMLSRGLCMRNGVLGVPGADREGSWSRGVLGVTSLSTKWLPHCLTRVTTSSCLAHFVSVSPTATTRSPTFSLPIYQKTIQNQMYYIIKGVFLLVYPTPPPPHSKSI